MLPKDHVYIEFNFTIYPINPASDILIAELSEVGFESFIENENGLLAYIQKSDFEEGSLDKINILQNSDYQISWASKEIEQQNWNAEWERNFNPIKVADECVVRAPFHPKENVRYDIVIEPKMSFGTGHHETTHMMLQHLLSTEIENKKVLDMGCGTGVLAILAEKRGAKAIDAIDNDLWCHENALENVSRNNCNHISVFHGDSTLLHNKKYDIVLANINKNILMEDIPVYANTLSENGILVLSGFYQSDMEDINQKCTAAGLSLSIFLEKNGWAATVYQNTPLVSM